MHEKPYDPDATKLLERRARMLFDAGEWFMFSKHLLKILKPDDALMLAAMVSLARYVRTGERRRASRGWFYYSIKQVAEDLRYSKKKQGQIIGRLRNLGYVKYRRIGNPPHREFKIRFLKVLAAIERATEIEEMVKKERKRQQ